jgi:molybdenum cofactor biosynthesis protein A
MLIDSFSRKHNYLRISVTDKCNLRCSYCMPAEGVKFLKHDQILRNEEFLRIIRIFFRMGVNKIRFTGGEPFVRKGFMDLLKSVREEFNDMELCLTTNGILLGRHLDELVDLNIRKINISLDTLSRERFREITGFDFIETVISAIEDAHKRDFFDLKVNCVLFNETLNELNSYLDFFREKKILIRFIERMPFTQDSVRAFVSSDLLIEALESRGTLVRNKEIDTNVAIMYDYTHRDGFTIKLGIIPPITHNFCSQCNRLRLTADGMLKTCLHSADEINLIDLLRNKAGDDKIMMLIAEGVNNKKREHGIVRDPLNGGCSALTGSRTMSKIGG